MYPAPIGRPGGTVALDVGAGTATEVLLSLLLHQEPADGDGRHPGSTEWRQRFAERVTPWTTRLLDALGGPAPTPWTNLLGLAATLPVADRTADGLVAALEELRPITVTTALAGGRLRH